MTNIIIDDQNHSLTEQSSMENEITPKLIAAAIEIIKANTEIAQNRPITLLQLKLRLKYSVAKNLVNTILQNHP